MLYTPPPNFGTAVEDQDALRELGFCSTSAVTYVAQDLETCPSPLKLSPLLNGIGWAPMPTASGTSRQSRTGRLSPGRLAASVPISDGSVSSVSSGQARQVEGCGAEPRRADPGSCGVLRGRHHRCTSVRSGSGGVGLTYGLWCRNARLIPFVGL